jgi:hypothetical protein
MSQHQTKAICSSLETHKETPLAASFLHPKDVLDGNHQTGLSSYLMPFF